MTKLRCGARSAALADAGPVGASQRNVTAAQRHDPDHAVHGRRDELPDLVYLEQLGSGQYLVKQDVVDTCREVLDRMRVEAATPADSLKTLKARFREA